MMDEIEDVMPPEETKKKKGKKKKGRPTYESAIPESEEESFHQPDTEPVALPTGEYLTRRRRAMGRG